MPADPDHPQSPVYRSPLRAKQAEMTRRLVLEAATRLFRERGWAGTTLVAVAGEAGTAIETVYAGFRSKSGLLVAAIDTAIVGDDEPVPLARRPEYAALADGDFQQRIRASVRLLTSAHDRSVQLLRALQEAAANDPGCSARWDRYEDDRREAIAAGLSMVLGAPPSGRLTDAMWALASPEVYAKLVVDRGWSSADYEQWLVSTADTLIKTTTR
jgi:AcrR family transcriptional regulator